MMSSREKAINLYSSNLWENFLSHFKFWEEPYEVIDRIIPKSGTVVELGCGEGLLSNFLAISQPKRKIIGYEIIPERLEMAKKRLKNTNYYVGDITKIHFPKADVFVLFHVLHHLPGGPAQERVLLKVKKSLNKNGKLIIVEVHVKPSLKYVAAWIFDHFLVPWVFEKRFYTRAYFRKENKWSRLLTELGFNVVVTEETRGRPFPNIVFNCNITKVS
ncbi:class I SAM-dependent methyltransferase [Patescibacteria group bacterium]